MTMHCPICQRRAHDAAMPGCVASLGYCDRCVARAVVLWEHDAYVLGVCAHHSRQHGPRLREQGWVIAACDLPEHHKVA